LIHFNLLARGVLWKAYRRLRRRIARKALPSPTKRHKLKVSRTCCRGRRAPILRLSPLLIQLVRQSEQCLLNNRSSKSMNNPFIGIGLSIRGKKKHKRMTGCLWTLMNRSLNCSTCGRAMSYILSMIWYQLGGFKWW